LFFIMVGHSPLIDEYRGIVEEAVFDRLGRPSFFEEAVRLVSCRAAERWAELNCANQNKDAWIRELALQEARRLVSEIEARFVEAGKLEL
jgi:hypothetical protein